MEYGNIKYDKVATSSNNSDGRRVGKNQGNPRDASADDVEKNTAAVVIAHEKNRTPYSFPSLNRIALILVTMTVMVGTIIFVFQGSSSGSGGKIIPRLCPPSTAKNLSRGGLIGRLLYAQTAVMTSGDQNIALNKDGSMLFVGLSWAEAVKSSTSSSSSVSNKKQRYQGRVDVYGWDCEAMDWRSLPSIYPSQPLAPGEADLFGTSISVSDDGWTVAVGAPQFGQGPGYVQVFSWDNVTNVGWIMNGTNATMAGHVYGQYLSSNFGQSVSISADGTLIAASGRNLTLAKIDDSVPIPYYVQVYRYNPSKHNWVECGQEIVSPATLEWDVDLIVEISGDGQSLVLSGGRLNEPLLYHFQNSTLTWIKDDRFAWFNTDGKMTSVSINHDCSKIAVGGTFQDAKNDDYPNGRGIRVFEISTDDNGKELSWSQIGQDILPAPKRGDDCFASSLVLDRDGTRFATSATSFVIPPQDADDFPRVIQGVVQSFEQQQPSDGGASPRSWKDIAIYDETNYNNLSSTTWGHANAVAMSGDGTVVAAGRKEFVDVYLLPSS